MPRPIAPSETREVGGLLLRKYRADDGPGFFALTQRNAERLAPHFPGIMQSVCTPQQAARYVRERMRDWDERHAYFFAVCDAAAAQIGQVRFKAVDWASGKSEIAYFVDHASEGQRLMTRALAALVDIGFAELGLAKVYARVAPDNHRSQRLLERGGFAREGVLRQDFRTHAGELADVVYYGLLRDEWEALRCREPTASSPAWCRSRPTC